MKVKLVSLGCAKNQVDSEQMLGRLSGSGCKITGDPAKADVIVVNTCSFIESAADESIDTILELSHYKTSGSCQRLIVTGCLPQRYGADIAQALPEVDCFLGTGAFDQIEAAVNDLPPGHRCLLPDPDSGSGDQMPVTRIRTNPHLAYLKIAEGCRRRCTYCIIPKLRGPQTSRDAARIEAEARQLIAEGVREIVLVAQETTAYGQDLKPPDRLSDLIHTLAALSPEVWLRILYGHPASIDDATIEAVAAHDNVCPYFDLPIQHASDRMLRRMGRPGTRAELLAIFERIRKHLPDAALRTSVIVGFPGETQKDMELLTEFVSTVAFDHLGVFTYCDAEDLPSHGLDGHVPAAAATERMEQILTCQVDISAQRLRRHIGRVLPVLIEEKIETDLYLGRTMFQAPEVDGVTYVRAAKLDIGTIVHVTPTEAFEYDLLGEPA